MEVDLHALELVEAEIEVSFAIRECKNNEESRIDLIHGYRGGNILKIHFRSQKFKHQMRKEGHQITRVKSRNPGITSYLIEK